MVIPLVIGSKLLLRCKKVQMSKRLIVFFCKNFSFRKLKPETQHQESWILFLLKLAC